jgi:hypothetical protein
VATTAATHLKHSDNSGSDKFSIYNPIHEYKEALSTLRHRYRHPGRPTPLT